MGFLKFLARHSLDLMYWLFITAMMAVGGYVFFHYRAKDCVFDITDPGIWRPFVQHEHVSPAALTLGSYIIPSVSIVLGTFFKHLIIKKETGLFFILAIVHLFDSICWAIVCKPRPDFMARCLPDFNSDIMRHYVHGHGQLKIGKDSNQFTIQTPLFVDIGICTSENKKFLRQEGFSSFPSGHAAFVFGCYTYLAMWLVRQYDFGAGRGLRSLDESQTSSGKRAKTWRIFNSILKMLFISSPGRPSVAALVQITFGIIISYWVACSRYTDNRHSGFDIISGAIFGTLIGWLGFKLFERPELSIISNGDKKAVLPDMEMPHERRNHTWG